MSDTGSGSLLRPLPFGRSIRAKFTIGTTALFCAIGALMLLIVYLAMRFIPSYNFPAIAADSLPSGTDPQSTSTGLTSASSLVVSSTSDLLNTLLVSSAVALLGVTVLGAIASRIFIGRMLRPLKALSNAASLTRQGSLTHRINGSRGDDELSQLSDSFDAMLEQLERSFAAQRRFAANASHEIRTPLATTKALLDVAQADGNAPEAALLLGRLSEMNARTIAITNAMLDLATIAEHSLEMRLVDMSEVVREQLRELEGDIEEAKITVTTKVRPSAVDGDRALLGLMVGNIIRNAVRHNVYNGEVSISIQPVDDLIELEVSNTGADVPFETVELLREPFYRAYGRVQSTDQRAGRGLGLALAASIVDAHHGTLRLEPKTGGGLTVSVVLNASEFLVSNQDGSSA